MIIPIRGFEYINNLIDNNTICSLTLVSYCSVCIGLRSECTRKGIKIWKEISKNSVRNSVSGGLDFISRIWSRLVRRGDQKPRGRILILGPCFSILKTLGELHVSEHI